MKLYKGNVTVTGRKSPYSLYDKLVASFEDDGGLYNQADAGEEGNEATALGTGRQHTVGMPSCKYLCLHVSSYNCDFSPVVTPGLDFLYPQAASSSCRP